MVKRFQGWLNVRGRASRGGAPGYGGSAFQAGGRDLPAPRLRQRAALRPFAFFQYECYFRTMIYLVTSRLPFNMLDAFPVTQQTHIEAKMNACPEHQ